MNPYAMLTSKPHRIKQPIPDSVAPSYPTCASRAPESYAPSGYEPDASKLTYGPANAAPANRNGEAATAAILDLIDMFVFVISQALKNLRMEILSTRILHSTQGTIFRAFVLCNDI